MFSATQNVVAVVQTTNFCPDFLGSETGRKREERLAGFLLTTLQSKNGKRKGGGGEWEREKARME